jgi:N-acetylglucosaminyl-diphospho-decaprenol L-rhamnosyltransferase
MTSLLSGPLAGPVRARRKSPAVQQAAPRLSVVIVNYRQWENTAALVRQVCDSAATRSGAAEVVVVDNHSPPHRLLHQLRRRPAVSLRRWGRNRGFSRAVNEGCRLSRGDWFLLLNPDVGITPGFIGSVLGLADQLAATEPDTGIVGFRLHNADGSEQLSSGRFPTLAGTLASLVLARAKRKYQPIPAVERCPVAWVTGCCLLVRGECWRELGGFDEDFFLYYEDVDLCRRAWEQGWSVWYEPQLSVVHNNPLHGRQVPAPLRLVIRHSLLTYAERHWRPWQFRALAGVVRLESWARRVWACCRGKRRDAAVFQELATMTRDLITGNRRGARKRVLRTVHRQEQAAAGLVNSVAA